MDISYNVKIYTDLKSKIDDGIYQENSILPTELSLQKEYGVSRAPVRQALGRLEAEGLIIRKAGKGTFVAARDLWKYAELGGFRAEFLKKADQVICKTLAIRPANINKKIEELFQNSLPKSVVRVERIRSIAGQPFQYLEHFIRDVDIKRFEKEGNINDMPLFLDRQGLILKKVQEEIDAVALPENIAKKIGLLAGTPVLKIKRYAYDDMDRMIEYVEYYTATEIWKYRVKYQ